MRRPCGGPRRCRAHGLAECSIVRYIEIRPISDERSWDENGHDVPAPWVVTAVLCLAGTLTIVALIINYLI